jgi:hypothetical protein
MIETIVILGPNFPVKALPSLERVDVWIRGIFSFIAAEIAD